MIIPRSTAGLVPFTVEAQRLLREVRSAKGCSRDHPDLRCAGADVLTNRAKITPFLKWPGGKRWLVNLHQYLFRCHYNRYIEPFLGAGSVYFHLKPAQAILGDLNGDLVAAYRGIKQDAVGVQILLERHHLSHCREYYYQIRDRVPSSLPAQAARITYLNRTCFNGIYRVNKRGEFNVPMELVSE